jgi:hypothetical protein
VATIHDQDVFAVLERQPSWGEFVADILIVVA